jgi:GTPase
VLHIIDAADEKRDEKIQVVDEILHDLGVPQERVLRVYNKVDAIGPGSFPLPQNGIGVSAATNDGLDVLREAIAHRFPQGV